MAFTVLKGPTEEDLKNHFFEYADDSIKEKSLEELNDDIEAYGWIFVTYKTTCFGESVARSPTISPFDLYPSSHLKLNREENTMEFVLETLLTRKKEGRLFFKYLLDLNKRIITIKDIRFEKGNSDFDFSEWLPIVEFNEYLDINNFYFWLKNLNIKGWPGFELLRHHIGIETVL